MNLTDPKSVGDALVTGELTMDNLMVPNHLSKRADFLRAMRSHLMSHLETAANSHNTAYLLQVNSLMMDLNAMISVIAQTFKDIAEAPMRAFADAGVESAPSGQSRGTPIAAESQNMPVINFDGKGCATLLGINFGRPQGHLEVLEFEVRIDRQPPCIKGRVQLHGVGWTASGAKIGEFTGDVNGLLGVTAGNSYITLLKHPNFSRAKTIAVELICNPFTL